MHTRVVPVSVSSNPGTGFREQLLKIIEKEIICELIIDDPMIPYQNGVTGYGNIYRYKFTGLNQGGQILLDSSLGDISGIKEVPNSSPKSYELTDLSGNRLVGMSPKYSFMAPRQPRSGYSTPLRKLYCRPIENFDVTGLRPGGIIGGSGGNRNGDDVAFLHIITGEKIQGQGRLKD